MPTRIRSHSTSQPGPIATPHAHDELRTNALSTAPPCVVVFTSRPLERIGMYETSTNGCVKCGPRKAAESAAAGPPFDQLTFVVSTAGNASCPYPAKRSASHADVGSAWAVVLAA